jgi:sugar transferase (PEP-CTERM system associated)
MASVLMRRVTWRSASLIICESALIVAAMTFAVYLRLGMRGVERIGDEPQKLLLIVVIALVCLYWADLYDFRVIFDRRELFVRSLQALGGASLILAAVYFWFPHLVVGRGVFMLAAAFVISVVLGWRMAFEWLAGRVGPRERLLLVGTNESAVRLARELYQRKDLGVEIVGFIDPDPSRVGTAVLNPGVVGTIEDIPTVARALSVDRVVVSLGDARGKLPMDKLLEMRLDGMAFDHLASVYEQYTGKIAVENLRPSWLIFSSGYRKPQLLKATKLISDVLAASLGLLLSAPLMLLIAAAIKASSRGPIFYHQLRVGQHGKVFRIHKFRSMHVDAEEKTGAIWARAGDTRVTRIGPLLRRTRLDELPQLWNVLRGDMSLVGPRPERPEFVASLTREIPFYGQRHIVKPGITGWAQVCYTYGASVEDALEKLQYDLFYIKNMSPALDLFILVKTIKTVVVARGGQ